MREMMSKIKCSICGSKEVTMIDHTNNYAFCYKCMPDVVYKDGFEFRKIRQEVNNDLENN